MAKSNGVHLYNSITLEDIVLFETDEWMVSVAFSPDGSLLASGSQGIVKLWDVSTRQEVATLTGHSGWVYSVVFSPDGSLLASGSWDKTVKLWDVSKCQEVATLTGHSEEVYSIAFSPDGGLLASGSEDGTVRLWDVSTRQEVATPTEASSSVYSVAFSPDGSLLASGSWDKTVKLWDVSTRQEVATLTGHSKEVQSVAFSPDGSLLASGSWDKTVKLWDVSTRQEVATLTGHSLDVRSVAFSPDGSLLASGDEDDLVRLWDVSRRQEVAILTGHSDWVNSVAFSPDGSLLASGSDDDTILLWNVTPYQPVDQLPVASFAYSPETPATNREITFDASSSGDPDGQIVSYEWDFGDGFTASDVNVIHSYYKADVYTVTLTIIDDRENVSRKSVNIPISLYPSAEISVPDVGPPTLDFANANDSKRVEMYKVIQQVFNVERVKAQHQGRDEDHLFNCIDSLLRQLDSKQRDGDLRITDMVRDGALTEGEELYIDFAGAIAGLLGSYVLLHSVPPAFLSTFIGDTMKELGFRLGEYFTLSDVRYVAINYPNAGRMEIVYRPSQNKILVNIYLECSVDQNIFMIIPVADDHLGTSWFDYISSLMWSGVTRPPEALVREPQPEIEDVQIIGLHSPAELRVHDSKGQVTGLVQGEIRNEIPNAYYYGETVVIFAPSDSYRYEVAGTDADTYGLTIFSVSGGEEATFAATDIPTTTVTRHQYVVDWEALSNGEEAVTVQIDSDGDGIFEKTAVADNEFTKDEYTEIVEPTIKGDVNDDGNVRSNDAVLVLRIAAGIMEPTEYQERAADMNDDGKIRSNDAMLILRKAAGLAAPGKDSIMGVFA